MTRSRRQRTPKGAAARHRVDSQYPETRHRGTHRGDERLGIRANRSRLWQVVGIAALLFIAVVGLAWWLLPFGDDGDASGNGPEPIATLDTPDVHSLLIDPEDPQRVLFGSHVGIMESHDGGFTWKSGALRGVDAMSMATSPNDAEVLYIAGHDVFLVSRDGGGTWQPVGHNLPGTDLHAFAQDPVDRQRLYAYVAGDRIYASTDGGTTWSSLSSQPSGPPLALASNGTTLFAATANGIETSPSSVDAIKWTRLPSQPGAGAMSLALPAADDDLIYAGTPGGVAKSVDGGATWDILGPQNIPVQALAVAPNDPNRVLFVTPLGDVYRSDDGGATWLAPN